MTGPEDGRTIWIDVAKTVGIFLVVFSHFDQNGFAESFLWTFHVPLFFFISGYLQKPRSDREFLGGITRRLVVPYVGIYTVIVLLSAVARADVTAGSPRSPTVLTQAWLRETITKADSLAPLLDQSAGLVVIEHQTDSPIDGDQGRASGERLCKEQLARRLPALQKRISDGLRRSDALQCQNRPGPPFCAFGVLNEYTTITYLLFRSASDGSLRLDAILELDGLLNVTNKSAIGEQENYVRQQLLRLRKTDCAGNAATPSELYRRFRAERF
jgi:hypothetical protein